MGIFVPAIVLTKSSPFPGALALIPCLSAAIIIYVNGSEATKNSKILASKPVVFVGLISYSLYLVHWPILVFLRHQVGVNAPISLKIVAMILSFLVAFLIWKFVEQPFRKYKTKRFDQTAFFVIGTTVILMLFASSVVITEGFSFRFPPDRFPWLYHVKPLSKYQTTINEIAGKGPRNLGSESTNVKPMDLLIWGDSHAMAIAQGFVGSQKVNVGLISRAGTPPVFSVWQLRHGRSKCQEWDEVIKTAFLKNPPKKVLLVARWSYYLGDFSSRTILGPTQDDPSAENAEKALLDGLRETVEWFIKNDTEVFILREVPHQMVDPLRLYTSNFLKNKFPVFGVSVHEHEEHQQQVNHIFNNINKKNVLFISTKNILYPDNDFTLVGDAGGCYYYDDDHLSDYAAKILAAKILEHIEDK